MNAVRKYWPYAVVLALLGIGLYCLPKPDIALSAFAGVLFAFLLGLVKQSRDKLDTDVAHGNCVLFVLMAHFIIMLTLREDILKSVEGDLEKLCVFKKAVESDGDVGSDPFSGMVHLDVPALEAGDPIDKVDLNGLISMGLFESSNACWVAQRQYFNAVGCFNKVVAVSQKFKLDQINGVCKQPVELVLLYESRLRETFVVVEKAIKMLHDAHGELFADLCRQYGGRGYKFAGLTSDNAKYTACLNRIVDSEDLNR